MHAKHESQKAIRRKAIVYAIAKLPNPFLTRDASEALVKLSHRLRHNQEPKWLAIELKQAGLYFVSTTPIHYLKELEQEGILTKQLVDRVTMEPVTGNGMGTYQWTFVGEAQGLEPAEGLESADRRDGWLR